MTGGPIPRDYDTDLIRPTLSSFSVVGDVHDDIGPRLADLDARPVLDLGCGRGRLLDALDVERWIGVDGSPSQLAHCPGGGRKALGEGSALPFADGAFGAVAALYCLYHFDEPAAAIGEAHRVLRPGGWFVCCTTSRNDAPELVVAHDPTTFDAEDAEAIVAGVFGAGHVRSEWWDGPYVHLADEAAVAEYLRGHLLRPEQVHPISTPLDLTKRGAVVWAEKV